MHVNHYLELYLTIYGWFMYDRLWEVFTDTGAAYVPFIVMVIRNFWEPYRSQDEKAAAIVSIRRIETDIVAMLTVVVLAAQPVFNVSLSGLSYMVACSGKTVKGGKTGTTYDKAFTTTTLGGQAVKVPAWWYGVLALSAGINDALILALPCDLDVRETKYKIANTRIENPKTRHQLQMFFDDCYRAAMYRFFNHHNGQLPPNVPPEDIAWPGSQFFMNTQGFYDYYHASTTIPGFPYDPVRDADFDPDNPPVYGRPTCKEWWSEPQHGIRQAVLAEFESDDLFDFQKLYLKTKGTAQGQPWEDVAIRTTIEQEETVFAGLSRLDAYTSNGESNAVRNFFLGLGIIKEGITYFPKIYLIKQFSPIAQAHVLMVIYMLLPIVLVFSGYSVGVVLFMSVLIFSIKFWTVMWAFLTILDNNLMTALNPSVAPLSNDVINSVLVNFATSAAFVVVPLAVTTLFGFAGFRFGFGINSMISDVSQPAGNAGAGAGKSAKDIASKGTKEIGKGKK